MKWVLQHNHSQVTISKIEGIDIEMRQHKSEGGNLQSDKQDALHSGAEPDAATTEYPSGIKFWLAVATICLGIFLITLDSTIVATAIPHISDDFYSLKDVESWRLPFVLSCISIVGALAVEHRKPKPKDGS